MSWGYQPPTHLAPVVEKVKNAIHRIAQLVSLILIRWIVIYPVDSAIQRLNNRGLIITDTLKGTRSIQRFMTYEKKLQIMRYWHEINFSMKKKKDNSSIDTRLPENTI